MIGARLKEERNRLGLTQEKFGSTAEAKPRTVGDWERGLSSPTSAQLAQLAEIGVDVTYVITGQRLSEALQHNIELMMKVTAEATQQGGASELTMKAIQTARQMARHETLSSINGNLEKMPDDDVRLVAQLVEKIVASTAK